MRKRILGAFERVHGGFTLIELLISIGIIGIMLTLLIPNIDRSLSKNDLANDAELFKSKVEETRLMAGSTQQVDADQGLIGAGQVRKTAYYAMFIPTTSHDYFAIVRLSSELDIPTAPGCTMINVEAAVNDPSVGNQDCIVQRNRLSRSVTLASANPRIIIFQIPSQTVFEGRKNGINWVKRNPDFGWSFTLNLGTKSATLSVEDYTAKITTTY